MFCAPSPKPRLGGSDLRESSDDGVSGIAPAAAAAAASDSSAISVLLPVRRSVSCGLARARASLRKVESAAKEACDAMS